MELYIINFSDCFLIYDTLNDSGTEKAVESMKLHKLGKYEGNSWKTRKYCRGCYKKKQKGLLHKNRVRKVTSYCMDCAKKPHFCLDCFYHEHGI